MKQTNYAAMAAIAIVFIGSLIVFSVGGAVILNQDRPKHFDDYAAMVRDSVVQEGPVTEYVPKNATHLRLFHNSQSGVTELEFRYDLPIDLAVEDRCSPPVKRNATRFYLCGWPYDGLIILHPNGAGELTTSSARIELAQQVLDR